MFLRAAKTEAEAAGESTDGMAESVSELRGELLALTGGKVDIQIDEDTFKSTYQILNELAGIWGELTDISRANILEMTGGKRNSNVVSALLENFDIAEDVLNTAADAEGSALAENEKYLKSVKGHVAEFKATFEELATLLIDSDFVSGVVDLGTLLLNLLEIVVKIVNALGGLPAAITAMLGALAAANAGAIIKWFTTLGNSIMELPSKLATVCKYIRLTSAESATMGQRINTAFMAAEMSATTATVAFSALATALTIGVAIYQKAKQRQEELRDKNIEAGDAAAEHSDAITELSAKYEELNESVKDDISLKGNLVKAEDELLKKLDLEKEKLEELIGHYGNYRDAMRAATADEYARQRPALQGEVAERKNDLLKLDNAFELGAIWGDLTGESDARSAQANKAIQALREAGFIPKSYIGDSAYQYNLGFEYDLSTIDGALEAYEQLGNMLRLLNDEMLSENPVFDSVRNSYNSLTSTVELYKEAVDGSNKALINQQIKLLEIERGIPGTQAEFERFRDLLANAVTKNGFDNTGTGLFTSIDDALNQWGYYDIFLDKLETKERGAVERSGLVKGIVSKATGDLKRDLDLLGDMMEDEFGGGNVDLKARVVVDNGDGTVSTVDSAWNEYFIGDKEYAIHYTPIVDGERLSDEELSRYIEDLIYTATDVSEVFERDKTSKGGLGILLRIAPEFDFDKENEWGQKLHEAQAKYYELLEYIEKVQPKINADDIENALSGLSYEELEEIYDAVVNNGVTWDTILKEIERQSLVEQYNDALSHYYAVATDPARAGERAGALNNVNSLLSQISASAQACGLSTKEFFRIYGSGAASAEDDTEDMIGATEEQTKALSLLISRAEEVVEEFDNTRASVQKLNGAMQDLENGEVLTADTAIELVEKYPSLMASLEEVAGGYKLSVEAMELARDASIREAEDSVRAQITKSKNILQTSKTVTGAILTEVAAINSLSDASNALNRYSKSALGLGGTDYSLYSDWDDEAKSVIYNGGLITFSDADKYELIKEKVANAQTLADIEELYIKLMLLENFDWESLGLDSSDGDTKFKKMESELENLIASYKHSIFLLENNDGDSASIVNIYRQMQDAVHAQAEQYRAMGLDENSEYIRQLQQQWWEFEDAIAEIRQTDFNDYINDSKFAIDVLKRDSADSSEIIDSWKTLLSAIDSEISYYASKGYDNTSDIIQELLNESWAAKDELIAYIDEIVAAANEVVDGLENVYKTLTDAAREYMSTGYLSVDSLQAILELGPQYLDLLKDENGELVINEEALQNVIKAKTEEMAADNALAYARKILIAAEQNDISSLEALTQVTVKGSGATWDMAYATLGLAKAIGVANGMDTGYFEDAVSYLNKMQSLSKTAVNSVSAYYATLDEGYISQKDSLNEILNLTHELIKWESEQKIEALEKEKELYNEIVDRKKEIIELAQKETEHDDDIAEKLAEISKLQSRIDRLSLDDSREATAERKQLEEELAELQKELSKEQSDYAIDTQLDALDKEAEAFEETKDEEIELQKELLSSTEKLYQAAIARIENGWDELYSELLDWNYNYGSTLESTLVSAWDAASKAVERYGSFVSALEETKGHTDLGGFDNDSSSDTVGVAKGDGASILSQMRQNSLAWFTSSNQKAVEQYQQQLKDQYIEATGDNIYSKNGDWFSEDGNLLYSLSQNEVCQAIVNAMKANSARWGAASATERTSLESQNKTLAKRLENYIGRRVHLDNAGDWWLDDKLLYSISNFSKYHTGGIAGGHSTLKQDEVMAILKEGEPVLDERREKGLYRIIDFVQELSDKLGHAIRTDRFDSFLRNNITLPTLGHSPTVSEGGGNSVVFSPSVTVSISHSGQMTDEEASHYGEVAAESVLQRFNEAFERRGISTISRALLKP